MFWINILLVSSFQSSNLKKETKISSGGIFQFLPQSTKTYSSSWYSLYWPPWGLKRLVACIYNVGFLLISMTMCPFVICVQIYCASLQTRRCRCSLGCAMARVDSRWPFFFAEARFQSQANLCVSYGKSGTRTDFSLRTLTCLSNHHSTKAPYSFILILSKLYNLSNWERH
jgi:hypothetical protein